MEELEYGDKVIISNGMFNGCNGIFFRKATTADYPDISGDIAIRDEFSKISGFGVKIPKSDDCLVEVFFKIQVMECPNNISDYFRNYLFNKNIPKKTTSSMIIISKKDIIKM